MRTAIDPSLHWTDHYVEYGFAVLKNLVTRDYAERALAHVARVLGTNLPPRQWTRETVRALGGGDSGRITIQREQANAAGLLLEQVYDQPGVRSIIDTMFGSPDHWSGERLWLAFVSAYNPDAPAEIAPRGHIDFPRQPIPIFGSGFMFQVSLIDSEPFSGNMTVYPGTHKLVQRRVIEDHDWRYPRDWAQIPDVEPFEFVAEAGDALLFHHLIAHEGNVSRAANRTPRVALHCQGLRKTWLTEVDPANRNLSPWERSLATNGAYRLDYDEKGALEAFYRQRDAKKPA